MFLPIEGAPVMQTEAHVVDSDATVVFTAGKLTGGSRRTVEFAGKHGKPVLHLDLSAHKFSDCYEAVAEWFRGELGPLRPPEKCVLNVVGSRESGAPGIHDTVMLVMIEVFRIVALHAALVENYRVGETTRTAYSGSLKSFRE